MKLSKRIKRDKENYEKSKERLKKWQENNREKTREYSKKYYNKKKEKLINP